METWTGAFLQLLSAYDHKESFYRIRECIDRRDAERALAQWIDQIPQGQKEAWKDLVKAASNWHEEMMTYFETDIPITNAFTESMSQLTAWPRIRTAMAEATHLK